MIKETQNNLREALKHFNLSYVSRETGINWSTLNMFKRGERNLSDEKFLIVADYVKSFGNKIY